MFALLATVHSNWKQWRLGALVWTVVFLTFELPAHFGIVPWPTLSRTLWDAESAWKPTALIVEVFFVVLLAHIVFRLSVIALFVVILGAALAVGSHFLWGTP